MCIFTKVRLVPSHVVRLYLCFLKFSCIQVSLVLFSLWHVQHHVHVDLNVAFIQTLSIQSKIVS